MAIDDDLDEDAPVDYGMDGLDQATGRSDRGVHMIYGVTGSQRVPMEAVAPPHTVQATPIFYNWNRKTPVRQAVFEALGAASVCWGGKNLSEAGEFDSARATKIGDELMAFLADRGVIEFDPNAILAKGQNAP